MADSLPTAELEYFDPDGSDAPVPGVLLAMCAGAPSATAVPLFQGELEVGRSTPRPGLTVEDAAMSRRHLRISFSAGQFEVEDLGSRNGMVVDGALVGPGQRAPAGRRVVRVGASVLVLLHDVRAVAGAGAGVESRDGVVAGPRLRSTWRAIADVSRASDVLHLRGESGSGKELAARRFHDEGRNARGPFVPINCAAIPEGVAERLLFGARKGAFSGAHADAEGLVQAADGGTLFLDEVGELHLDVQAKLLRVLESRTVLAMGAVKPQPVDLRVVSATHRALRALVADGEFREDLFYRLARPEVQVPPLRDRPEELSYLIAMTCAGVKAALAPAPALVEAALLRRWPGNVRELVLEVREAARRAAQEGTERVEARHLDPAAGLDVAPDPQPGEPASGDPSARRRVTKQQIPPREVIEATLREVDGQVATAARKLGIHRTQLRRWLEENGVDPRSFSASS